MVRLMFFCLSSATILARSVVDLAQSQEEYQFTRHCILSTARQHWVTIKTIERRDNEFDHQRKEGINNFYSDDARIA